MNQKTIIPKTWQHDSQMVNYGISDVSINSKQYCKCDTCTKLRARRDEIFKSKTIRKAMKKYIKKWVML